jgi:hypothetical protein
MVVDDVANISEVHAACVFRIELCRLVRFWIYITFCIEKEWGKEWGFDLSKPVGIAD